MAKDMIDRAQVLRLLRNPSRKMLMQLFTAGNRAIEDDVAWSTEATKLELKELADIIESL